MFGTRHFDTFLVLSKSEDLKVWFKEKRKQIFDPQDDIRPVLEVDGEQWRQYKFN